MRLGKKLAVAAMLTTAVAFGCGGYVLGQQKETRSAQEDLFAGQLILAEIGYQNYLRNTENDTPPSDWPNVIARLYATAAGNPALTKIVTARAVGSYYIKSGKEAKSAAHVSQPVDEASLRLQLLQTAQNQRIISLLEQIAKKK